MGVGQYLRGLFSKSTEGSDRGPALAYSHWGNPYPVSFGDGFQQGLSLATSAHGAKVIPIAFSCVMLSAKAMALCPAAHLKLVEGRWVKQTTSPASKMLRRPNSYQTWAQFILNAIAMMLFEGEAFVMLSRDNSYRVAAMHLLSKGACAPYVDPTEGEVFYSIGANEMTPGVYKYMAPARDIMHLRQYCPRHPLVGETALKAAGLALGINVALGANQANFFSQASVPSGILTTDATLTRDQTQQLRKAWEDQTTGANVGKVPIATNGLKFQSMGITSQDAQLIEAQRMSIEEVARVMGVPLPLVGDPTAGGVNNTETLINFWLAMGLGSLIENVESSLEKAFDFGLEDEIEIDVEALLRTDLKTRLEALSKGVQGGIYKPDEARAKENLPPVEGGDVVYMQRQMTPASLLEEIAAAELVKLKAPPPAPAPVPANPPTPADPDADTPPDPQAAKALVLDLIARKSA